MALSKGKYPHFKGLAMEPLQVFPNSAQGSANTVPAEVRVVSVGANVNGTDDFITLPSLATVPDGHEITVYCNTAGMEVRTPADSDEEINSENCDGTKEYTVPSGGQVHIFRKINNTIGWMGQGFTAIGAVATAIVPDA